jgi:endonuclease/exonuclease/phosphatase family metal-dependent hydrolase
LIGALWLAGPGGDPWARDEAVGLRLMTFNVADGLCSTARKDEPGNRWAALARIVAALQPDVLLLQEAGDNAGHGTGEQVDAVAELELTLRLFVSGGRDTFLEGQPVVTQFVQAHAPAVELPHVFVSTETDGYNRNAILSRHPFVDLNGDGLSMLSDLPPLQPHLYAPGGDGGLRGCQIAEIDLPDERHRGDLVVTNSHLKAGTSPAAHGARVDAARNLAYLIEHLFNGAGTGRPDPHGTIGDLPPVRQVLGRATLLVAGGDWNEDERANGPVRGPADWIVAAALPEWAGGFDGTDRDGSDMRAAQAADPFTGSTATHYGTRRDYLAWQDSIAARARAFVFDTATLPASGRATPHELLGFPGGVADLSDVASDHRPVVLDLRLEPAATSRLPVASGADASPRERPVVPGVAALVRAARRVLEGRQPGPADP